MLAVRRDRRVSLHTFSPTRVKCTDVSVGKYRLLEVMEKLKVYGDEKLPSGSLLTI